MRIPVVFTVASLCIGLVFATANEQDTLTQYSLEINEQGTTFTERVEIEAQNTLTYHVPTHNDVDQSDMLIVYDEMLCVTRIPRVKECHVENAEEDELNSAQKVFMDMAKLKIIYKGKPEGVRTIQKTVVKNGRFLTRNPVITKFCGSYPIFKMEVIEIQDSDSGPQGSGQGHRIQKRSSNKRYLATLKSLTLDSIKGEGDNPTDGPTADDDGDDDDDIDLSSSGRRGMHFASGSAEKMYFDYAFRGNCKNLEDYNVDDCIQSPKRWAFTAVPASSTCMYQVKCRATKIVNGKVISGECSEVHRRSREVCYNLSCKSTLA